MREKKKKNLYFHTDDKNELLFSKFDIYYNNEPAMFRKGWFFWCGCVCVDVVYI